MLQSTIDQVTNSSAIDLWTIISGIIGILGFVISLINAIHYFMIRKVNLDIKIIEYGVREYASNNDIVFVHYQIDNKSQLPISVIDMQLVIDGVPFSEDSCTHEILSYKHKIGKEIVDYQPTYNSHIPISLSNLSSRADYLAYVIPRDSLKNGEKFLTFQIRTNRGKEIQRTFALNESATLR